MGAAPRTCAIQGREAFIVNPFTGDLSLPLSIDSRRFQVNSQLPFRAIFVFMFVAAIGAAARDSSAQRQANKPKPSSTQTASTENAEGERLLQTQCSRCHIPPDDLSPREAKAVLRQMRVRANLTAEDERLILKYLAP